MNKIIAALLAGVTLLAGINLAAAQALPTNPPTPSAGGLADLERRNYRVRLRPPKAQELAAITERFNALAHALDAARAENEALNHRLITAQDDERKRTALELHDEVGPESGYKGEPED